VYPGLGHPLDIQVKSSDESRTGRYLGYFLDLPTLGYSDVISSGKSWTGTLSGYSGMYMEVVVHHMCSKQDTHG
jgi:hypothetical protein